MVYGSSARLLTLPFSPLIVNNVLARFFIVYRLSAGDRQRAILLLEDWLLRGALKHNIAARYALEEIAQAHSMVEQGRAVGNVILSIE